LHLGHAYSAILNDVIARALGGLWLLRIEDIDPVRATPENIRGVLEDLAWLGLRWPEPVRYQSEHMALYARAADRLREAGLLYPCFCSRGEIAAAVAVAARFSGADWPRDQDGAPLYPGTCRRLPPGQAGRRIDAGKAHGWRLDMRAAARAVGTVVWRAFDPSDGERSVAADPARWGDLILVRKETPTSYHLSVVVDDAVQGITHVVRGRDLLAATDVHALLAALLRLELPRYHHHELLTDPRGLKLSKSRNSLSLAAMREAGMTAEEVRATIAKVRPRA
jgi:glutamyl-Q tRNA(Asp) synthetase